MVRGVYGIAADVGGDYLRRLEVPDVSPEAIAAALAKLDRWDDVYSCPDTFMLVAGDCANPDGKGEYVCYADVCRALGIEPQPVTIKERRSEL